MFGNAPPFFHSSPPLFVKMSPKSVCLPRLPSGNHLPPGVWREGAPLRAAFGRQCAELAVLSPRGGAGAGRAAPARWVLGLSLSPWPWPSSPPSSSVPCEPLPVRSSGTQRVSRGTWLRRQRHPPSRFFRTSHPGAQISTLEFFTG